jgi:hypothetical protein
MELNIIEFLYLAGVVATFFIFAAMVAYADRQTVLARQTRHNMAAKVRPDTGGKPTGRPSERN